MEYETDRKLAGVPKQGFDTSDLRDHQAALNEASFTQLNDQFQSAQRDEEMLEQALTSARTRRMVLEAAMNVLNAPAQATAPSLR